MGKAFPCYDRNDQKGKRYSLINEEGRGIMGVKSVNLVGVAEGIRGHELSTKSQIENLKNRLYSLEGQRKSLHSTISGLEAAIAAAYEDTDEDGSPNYALISALESRKYAAESELYAVREEIQSTGGMLEGKKRELESVEEEKAKTLFEIQERARQTSANIGYAGLMRGDFAGAGSSIRDSMNRSLSALVQAAGILGGSVSTASAITSGGTGGSGGGGFTVGSGGAMASNALIALSGEDSGIDLPISAERFFSSQSYMSTPGTSGHFGSGGESLNTKPIQNFSTKQITNSYACDLFKETDPSAPVAMNMERFSSSQASSDSQTLIQPEKGTATFSPSAEMKNGGQAVASTPASAYEQLRDYMYAHNYGRDDFAIYSKDPEWQRLHKAAFPESNLTDAANTPASAYEQLRDYMYAHNYGRDDFAVYSKDPEWQRLHRAAFPESNLTDVANTPASAYEQLRDYMYAHNYGRQDFAVYSKDPEWQRLHRAAFPGSAVSAHHSVGYDGVSAKIGDRARNVFNQLFGNGSAAEGSSQPVVSQFPDTQPVNQILYNSLKATGESELQKRFNKLKDIKVSELTEENKKEIVKIAIENLRQQHGKYVNPARLESMEKKITFITDSQMKADLGSDYSPCIQGYFTAQHDCIRINIDGNSTVGDLLATIDHEGLHFLTQNFWRGSTGVKFTSAACCNVAMNEGLTELYSIRNMQSVFPEYTSYSYIEEVSMVRRIESIFGTDRLYKAYVNNDVSEMRAEFNACMGNSDKITAKVLKSGNADAFDMLCSYMDAYHYFSGSNNELDKKMARKMKDSVHIMLNVYKEAKNSGEPANDSQWDRITTPLALVTDSGKKRRFEELRKQDKSAEEESRLLGKDRRKSFADRLRAGSSLAEQAAFANAWNNRPKPGSSGDAPNNGERERSIEKIC